MRRMPDNYNYASENQSTWNLNLRKRFILLTAALGMLLTGRQEVISAKTLPPSREPKTGLFLPNENQPETSLPFIIPTLPSSELQQQIEELLSEGVCGPISPTEDKSMSDNDVVRELKQNASSRERRPKSQDTILGLKQFSLSAEEIRAFGNQFSQDAMERPASYGIPVQLTVNRDGTFTHTESAKFPNKEVENYAVDGLKALASYATRNEVTKTEVRFDFPITPSADGSGAVVAVRLALNEPFQFTDTQGKKLVIGEGTVFNTWDNKNFTSYLIPFAISPASPENVVYKTPGVQPMTDSTTVHVTDSNVQVLVDMVRSSAHPEYEPLVASMIGQDIVLVTTDFKKKTGEVFVLGFLGTSSVLYLVPDSIFSAGSVQIPESTPSANMNNLQNVTFVENTDAATAAHKARYAADTQYKADFNNLPSDEYKLKVITGKMTYIGKGGWQETVVDENGQITEREFWQGITKKTEDSWVKEETAARFESDGFTIRFLFNKEATATKAGKQFDTLTKVDKVDEAFQKIVELMRKRGFKDAANLVVVILPEESTIPENKVVLRNRLSKVEISYDLTEIAPNKFVLFIYVDGPGAESNFTVYVCKALGEMTKADPGLYFNFFFANNQDGVSLSFQKTK